jgi:hypothetical protein
MSIDAGSIIISSVSVFTSLYGVLDSVTILYSFSIIDILLGFLVFDVTSDFIWGLIEEVPV